MLELKLQGESQRGPKSFNGILRSAQANNRVIRENKIKSHREYPVVHKPSLKRDQQFKTGRDLHLPIYKYK
jgi:hypothetical protein